jgi:hypothetical protein
MILRMFRSGVNGQGQLKQKGVKHTDEKQGLGVHYLAEFYTYSG